MEKLGGDMCDPANQRTGEMETWTCPRCGETLTLQNNFGREIIPEGTVIYDLFGKPIRSHRFGVCCSCWSVVELINGKVATSILVPPDLVAGCA